VKEKERARERGRTREWREREPERERERESEREKPQFSSLKNVILRKQLFHSTNTNFVMHFINKQ